MTNYLHLIQFFVVLGFFAPPVIAALLFRWIGRSSWKDSIFAGIALCTFIPTAILAVIFVPLYILDIW